MSLSKGMVIKFTIMLVFLVCMLFANFYAVRKLMQYGMEVYFYDKLSVAYSIGGAKGLEEELEKMRSTDKMPRELPLAKEFEIKLKNLQDPAVFLRDKVEQNKERISLIRSLRSAAIILMFFIFAWRLSVNLCGRFKCKKSAGNPF